MQLLQELHARNVQFLTLPAYVIVQLRVVSDIVMSLYNINTLTSTKPTQASYVYT